MGGTVPNHVYAEHNCSLSKADIESLTKTWWDGSSAGWSSDADYAELARTGHKAEGNGLKCMLMGRNEFGDGGAQHIITQGRARRALFSATLISLASWVFSTRRLAILLALSPWLCKASANPTRNKGIDVLIIGNHASSRPLLVVQSSLGYQEVRA